MIRVVPRAGDRGDPRAGSQGQRRRVGARADRARGAGAARGGEGQAGGRRQAVAGQERARRPSEKAESEAGKAKADAARRRRSRRPTGADGGGGGRESAGGGRGGRAGGGRRGGRGGAATKPRPRPRRADASDRAGEPAATPEGAGDRRPEAPSKEATPSNRFILLASLACAVLAGPGAARARAAGVRDRPAAPRWLDGARRHAVRVVAGRRRRAGHRRRSHAPRQRQPQTAKSDGSGRATFREVPAGATVQASIVDEQQKPATSVKFPVPPSGGTRLMLSDKPFTGAPASHARRWRRHGGEAPRAPATRAMSGQPRPDRGMEPGTYQVRLTYNNLTVQNGAAHGLRGRHARRGSVALVGYRSDDSGRESVRRRPTPTAAPRSRASTSAAHTSYFACARLPRAGGGGSAGGHAADPGDAGGRQASPLGRQREANTPLDEAMTPQSTPTPAGKVRVSIEGVPLTAPVSLVDATTKTVLATATPSRARRTRARSRAAAVRGGGGSAARRRWWSASHGGPGSTDAGSPTCRSASSPPTRTAPRACRARPAPTGRCRLQALADKPQKAVLNVNGGDLVSEPFYARQVRRPARRGGALGRQGPPRGDLRRAVPAGAGALRRDAREAAGLGARGGCSARCRCSSVPTVGVHLPISVLPRIITNFSEHADIEDQLLWVRGTYRSRTWRGRRARRRAPTAW